MKNTNLKEISKKLIANRVDFMSAFRTNVLMFKDSMEISVSMLAEKSRMPPETLRTFLYNDTRDAKLSNAVCLARALNVSIDELIGADTIPALTRESLAICRNLPDNDLMLVRWFIRCLDDLNRQNEPNKRYVTVMLPEENNNGDCKLVSKFEKLEITDLQEPLRSKIFIGFKIISDYYIPYYFPNDIILIANDRPAKPNEHVVVRAGDYIYIVRRIVENGIAKFYSIRDNKYRIDENDVDELIGYIVCSKK